MKTTKNKKGNPYLRYGIIALILGVTMAFSTQAGRVGIGTSDPEADLHVAGTGKFEDILDMTGQKIINVATPIDGTDAVNKDYVDAQSGGGGSSPKIRLIRMTSNEYTGDLGGFSGADAKCQLEFPDTHFCTWQELYRVASHDSAVLYNEAVPSRFDYSAITFDERAWFALDIGYADFINYEQPYDCLTWTNSGVEMGRNAYIRTSTYDEASLYYPLLNDYHHCGVPCRLWCCDN